MGEGAAFGVGFQAAAGAIALLRALAIIETGVEAVPPTPVVGSLHGQ